MKVTLNDKQKQYILKNHLKMDITKIAKKFDVKYSTIHGFLYRRGLKHTRSRERLLSNEDRMSIKECKSFFSAKEISKQLNKDLDVIEDFLVIDDLLDSLDK